jgi:hypothetical protein
LGDNERFNWPKRQIRLPDESPINDKGFADLVKANQPTIPINAQEQKYENCLKSMASRQFIIPPQSLQGSDKKQPQG